VKVNHLKTFIVKITTSLAIILTIFISPSLWADEITDVDNSISFNEKLAHADNIRSSHPKQFLVLINELNQLANNLSNSQQFTLDYLNFYLLIYQGNLTEAINSAKVLLNSNADSLLKFRAKLSLINTFANKQSWTEGLATISSMLEELPLIKDKKLHHLALIITSIFYNQLGQYNLGLFYARKVELTSKQGRDNCIAKMLIIESSFRLKQLTPTSQIIDQAISLCRTNNEYLSISFINSYVAKMHLENQQHDKALALLQASLQETLNTQYSLIIAEYYSLLAQAHWLNNNTELTKQFALKALEYEKAENTNAAKLLAYKLLFEVTKAEENYQLALNYHQKYTIADKLFYAENHAKHLAFQLAEHQAIEQKNRIDLLHEKNNFLTTEQALIKANAENTRFIMIILIIALTVLAFWGYRLLRAHRRIKQLAEYDALTGIFNRGHFSEVASKAIDYCQTAEQELSLIVFDLDHFKSINDNYGHACGDWALKETINVCKTIGRKNDIFARLGGEEFCILLTSCNSYAAQLRAEACRKAIAEIDTTDSGFDFTITASFGITEAKTSGYELDKLLADADSAAYASKHAGRNQVTIFEQKQTEELPKEKLPQLLSLPV
jgi:diguanylate cyclase (GGDEF)-like protein